MCKEASCHLHPRNPNQNIFGIKLQAGDVIKADDVYDSSDGTWKKTPCPGLILQEKCNTYWVRPVKDKSE